MTHPTHAAYPPQITSLTLPDLLAPGLRLVFVGINPSVYSAERGQYFARPSNRFWSLLNGSGLLPVPLGPADGAQLLHFGIGLTDLVKRATPAAADLTAADYSEGRESLRQRLLAAAPRVVCFVGKIAYQQFAQRRDVAYGRQPEPLGVSALFVMPSSSGRCNHLHRMRVQVLADVAAHCRAAFAPME